MPTRAFPVSCKGVVVVDGRVLLARNERDEWELPGGKLEVGEQPEDCVAREISEESGWPVTTGPILDAWLYRLAGRWCIPTALPTLWASPSSATPLPVRRRLVRAAPPAQRTARAVADEGLAHKVGRAVGMHQRPARRCEQCGAMLSRYNPDSRCGLCQAAARDNNTTAVPATRSSPGGALWVWAAPSAQAVLSTREPGVILAAYRAMHHLSQVQLAVL